MGVILIPCSRRKREGSQGDVGFLPAWERYDGNLYRAARLQSLYPRTHTKVVLIVSPLYGLLGAEDPIREYDIRMDCRGPDGLRKLAWWKHRRLGQLVTERVLSLGAGVFHDLLSDPYRQALAPWPARPIRELIHQHQFPGQGIGTDHARGRQLRKILEEPWVSLHPMQFTRRRRRSTLRSLGSRPVPSWILYMVTSRGGFAV